MDSFGQLGGYDISFFLAAIPFQAILILYFWLKRQMPLRESRVFMELMLANLATLVTDLFAIYACVEWRTVGAPGFYFWNILYFLCMDFLGYSFAHYVGETLHIFQRIGSLWRYVMAVPAIVFGLACLSSPWTGLIFTLDMERGYVSGPYYFLLYRLFTFYLLLGLLSTLACGKQESRKRRISLATAMMVLLAGLYLRSTFNHVLVYSYVCTVVITITFIVVRNPDLYLDTETGLLSRKGFRLVLRDWALRRPLYGFGFVIRDYAEMRAISGEDRMDGVMGEIGNYIRENLPHTSRFYLKDGRFFILSSRPSYLVDAEEKLKERFTGPWEAGGQVVTLDISLVTFPGALNFSCVDELTRVVQDAFRAAASPAVGMVLVDESYRQRVARRVHVWNMLDQALSKNSLEVFLQPLIAADTGKPAGAEALVRLRDEDGSLIPPGDFIPQAEENGVVSVLGLQVFDKVCRFIKNGGLTACHMGYVNVNLSPVQCMHRDLADRLEEIRNSYGVKPQEVRLEITEQSALSEHSLGMVETLHHLGYPLVLDDYGTGYSNAGRMKDLPLSQIKIDMSLVWDHFKHPTPYLPDMVRTLKGLGYSVVAEGVETKEMARALGNMGVDIFQGFHYSKPVPMAEFLAKYGHSLPKAANE